MKPPTRPALLPILLLSMLPCACGPDPSKDTEPLDSGRDSTVDTRETDTWETADSHTETGDSDANCTWYPDRDKDSFGDASEPMEAPCDSPPAGALLTGTATLASTLGSRTTAATASTTTATARSTARGTSPKISRTCRLR